MIRQWIQTLFCAACVVSLIGCGSDADDSSPSSHSGNNGVNNSSTNSDPEPAPPPRFSTDEFIYLSAENVISVGSINDDVDPPQFSTRAVYTHPTAIRSFIIAANRFGIYFTADDGGEYLTHAAYSVDAAGENLSQIIDPLESTQPSASLRVHTSSNQDEMRIWFGMHQSDYGASTISDTPFFVTDDGYQTPMFPCPLSGPVAPHPSSNQIAVVEGFCSGNTTDNYISLYDSPELDERTTLLAEGDNGINDLAFVRTLMWLDDTRLIVGLMSGTLVKIDIHQPHSPTVLHTGFPGYFTLSPDRTMIVAATNSDESLVMSPLSDLSQRWILTDTVRNRRPYWGE